MMRLGLLAIVAMMAVGCFDGPLSPNGDNTTTPFPPLNTTPFDRDLPAEGYLTTVLQTGDTVYFFGGMTRDGDAVDSVWAFDLGRRVWIPRSPMPTRRYYAAAVSAGGAIYVIGGRDRIASTERLQRLVERYDPRSDSWTTLGVADAPDLDAVSPTFITAARGRIYGISTLRTGRNTLLYESEDGITWKEYPLAIEPEHEPTLMSDGDNLYLLSKHGHNFGRNLYRIDPATRKLRVEATPYGWLRGYTDRWLSFDGSLYTLNGAEGESDIIAHYDVGGRSWGFNSVPYDITTNRHFVPIVSDWGMRTLYLFAPPNLRIGTHYSTLENRFFSR